MDCLMFKRVGGAFYLLPVKILLLSTDFVWRRKSQLVSDTLLVYGAFDLPENFELGLTSQPNTVHSVPANLVGELRLPSLVVALTNIL